MPEGLTQTKTPNSPKTGRRLIGTPAGFKSEWWPTSDRNGGRLQIGIPGRNESESAAEHAFAAGTVGLVTHRFRPGFSATVLFGDNYLYMKEQFMEPAGLELRPAAERLVELSEEIVKATSLGKNPDLRTLSLIVAATRDLQKEARPEVLIEISDGIATVGAVNGSVKVSFADLDVEDAPDEDDIEDALEGDVFTGTAADLEAAKAKFRQELEDRTGGFEP